MMGALWRDTALACHAKPSQRQPTEVMCNGQLETNSLSLALSTRVTVHESGTSAPSLSVTACALTVTDECLGT
jgi:hypothetical protein